MKFSGEKNALIISLGYLPTFGGSYRVLHELIIRSNSNNIILLTCKDSQTKEFDKTLAYKVHRSNFLSLLNNTSLLFNKISMQKVYHYMYFRLLKKIFTYIIFPFVTLFYLIFVIHNKKIGTIVFAQSVLPFAWYIYFFKKFIPKKSISFVYGEDIVSFRKQGKINKFFRRIYLLGLKKSDIIIANSSVTKDEIFKDGISENKIVVIYPAVDYSIFKPFNKNLSKDKFNLRGNYVLLSVGRLIRRKGFDTVLDCLPDIIKKIPNLMYIICGNGYDEAYLQSKIASNKLQKYVRILHNISYPELPFLYDASDIFVLPNRLDELDQEQEGFGIVFLEANACGVPVIGGDSGGVKDIISNGENGFLIDPNNREGIINKISEIYHSTDRFTESSIRDYIVKKYNWVNSADLFQNLL